MLIAGDGASDRFQLMRRAGIDGDQCHVGGWCRAQQGLGEARPLPRSRPLEGIRLDLQLRVSFAGQVNET